MRYLNSAKLATVTIQNRQAVCFAVPVDLAMLLFWFLASPVARLVALVVWCVVRGLVRRYHRFCDYLAGWRRDLNLMWSAFLDLFGVQIYAV